MLLSGLFEKNFHLTSTQLIRWKVILYISDLFFLNKYFVIMLYTYIIISVIILVKEIELVPLSLHLQPTFSCKLWLDLL